MSTAPSLDPTRLVGIPPWQGIGHPPMLYVSCCRCHGGVVANRATTSFTSVGTFADFTLSVPHRPSLVDDASAPWQGTALAGGGVSPLTDCLLTDCL